MVFGDAWLRRLVLLAWLAGILIAPEALAAPVAAGYGAGPEAVGLLLAADPIGVALGALIAVRVIPEQGRPRAISILAIGTGIPMVGCLAQPGLVVVWLLWLVSGLLAAYIVLAFTAFAVGVPPGQRGQAFGLAQSGLIAIQGIGLWVAGLVADYLPPLVVVGLAGALSIAAALVILRLTASPVAGQVGDAV